MRIALIGPTYPYRGGIAHYTTKLAQTLRERGHELLFVSFKRQYPRWLFPGQSDKDPSVEPVRTGDVEYWIDSLNPVTWLITFWRICRYRPQLFILQWWTTFWAPVWLVIGGLYRILDRGPLLILCHNVLPHEAKRGSRQLTRLVLRLGTHFIAQSESEQERLLQLLPKARVSVVPHPVYDMFTDKRLPKDVARAQLNIEDDIPVLLFFGIVREYKGLEDLLQAMPHIKKHLPKVMLLIAGEFWDPLEPYRELIETLGIGDAVRIDARYIPNEEVSVYFSAADLVVAPYRRTTGSGVVQLAVGFGTPVVTTLFAENFRLLPETPLLMCVPFGDNPALAQAIERFFLKAVSPTTEASKMLREAFSWDRLAETVEQIVV